MSLQHNPKPVNEDFKKEIIKDLLETGFGSEMKVLNIFLKKRRKCTGKYAYLDKDQNDSSKWSTPVAL